MRQLPGGVEEYLRLRATVTPSYAVSAPAASVASSSAPAASATTVASASPAEQRDARKVMARVEKQLSRLASREERIHALMTEHVSDHAKVLELNQELRGIVDEREVLELEWLEAAEVLEP